MAMIPVGIAGRPYEVRVAPGLLANVAAQCGAMLRKQRVPIVTDAKVHAAWGETVGASLIAAGFEPRWKVLPSGEATKSWAHLAEVIDWLLAEEVERKDHILALGGGVIGDLTGFAAAMLKRGCNFIQLPTTLLSQVDSSVGGKTAINTAAGKNLVGAFHQPSLVLADPLTLDTLPLREVGAGYAEVVKYGVLGDPAFFQWCEANGAALMAGDQAAREYAIAKSVEAKAAIVAQDEFETKGLRALLNLGHTFGHALEAETGFSNQLLHGEGVALGMVLAARYSARIGLIPAYDAERVAAHFRNVGMQADLSALGLTADGKALVAHMLHDKKMDAGTLPFILLRSLGEAFVAKEVKLDDVAAFLDEQLAG
jgi:3-dehydroquinate synthase